MSAYVPQPYNERLDSLADLTAPSLTGLLAMNSSGDLVEGGTVQSFGGYNLVQKSATSGGTWGPMDGSAIMFLGDTAYLIGGWYGDIANADWTGNITTNLVYRSTNFGVTWTRIRDHDLTPDSAHFSPRHTFPHCVHRVGSTDYMYLFSGDISEPNSDVRRSTDGITWTKVNSVAPGYDGLSLAAAGSLNGNLYLVGGATVLDTAGHKNAVWRSTDNGVTWTNLGNAPWAIRSTVDRLVNHDGKLWLIGGGIYDDTLGRTYYNDVWSFDGTTWTEVLEDGHSQWTARMYAATFAIGGWLYISRGYNAANLSDTFRSRDGITWFPVNITLEASHADAIGTHADGALIGPGNGLLTNNVNTNSPTRWLEVTGSDDDLPTSIASMISSAQVNPNPEFATIILGLFLYTESGQIGIGEDASGFYVCAGATDSNKTINIGSDATPEIRVKATRLEVSGTIFATAATFNGEVLSYGDTNGTHTLLNRNDNAGSSAYSRLVLNAYGNSWGIGMGSTANNSNALEIREDALGANTLRFAMAIGGAATFNGAVIGESYRATNGYFVSQESGVDKWMSYSVSGTFYLRDAVNSRSHATHFPGVNAAAALTQFSSRLQVDEAATFNGTATFGQGLVATGAYPYGSSGVPGAISYEHPYTRNFAGDGSGYTWAVSKRTGGVTTDLFTIYDASGAATFNGSLTITKTGSNGLVVNNTAGNALAIFNASAASVTDNAYLTIQTAGSDRWYVGQSVSGLTGNFEIYGTAFGGSMLTLNRTTGAMTANAATFNSNVGVGGKIQLSNSGTGFGSALTNGNAQFYTSATAGLIVAGSGSSSDFLLTNKSGSDVLSVPTGTSNVDFAGSVTATSLALTNGSNKPLTSYRDASYSGWHNGTSLISNEAYIMGSNAHYFSVGGTNRLEIASGSQFNGALTVTGYLNIGSADCRMFRGSGNFYFESDGNFSFQDTSTAAVLMLLANDGRLFLKTNVWHPDSDGNARLLYNGSGGATNFNGAYDFVSDTKGHGFLSDGSIRWGSNAVSGNNRGYLSWDTDKAIIGAPLKLDIQSGGLTRYIATSHEFNSTITSLFSSSTSDLSALDLSAGQMRVHKNTLTGDLKVFANDGGSIKTLTFV